MDKGRRGGERRGDADSRGLPTPAILKCELANTQIFGVLATPVVVFEATRHVTDVTCLESCRPVVSSSVRLETGVGEQARRGGEEVVVVVVGERRDAPRGG